MKKTWMAALAVTAISLMAAPPQATSSVPATAAKVEKASKKTTPAQSATPKSARKGGPTQNASAAEIASAKTKGLVWVNTSTGVYHKDGEYFGATKEGKFMTEAEAQKGGFRTAKDSALTAKTSKRPTK